MEVDIKQKDNNVLKKSNDTQSTSDTDIFCSEFNSVFDKNIETDTALRATITALIICKVRGLKSAWRSAHPSWRASQRSDWNVERGFGVWRCLEVGFLIP